MKRTKRFLSGLAGVALISGLTVAQVATAATPVNNLTVAKNGDFTEVTLPVPSRLLCEHFTEKATADRPFRIVLNLCNADHALVQQTFSNLPACVVSRIRTSQFATKPEPIVRVVIDLNSSATYSVRTEADRLVIAIADPKARPFAAWQANPGATLVQSTAPVKTPVTSAEPLVAEKLVPTKPQITPPAPAPSEPPVLTASQSTHTEVLSPVPVAQPQLQPKTDFVKPEHPLILAPEVLDALAKTTTSQPSTIPAPPANAVPAVNTQDEQIWAAATDPVGAAAQPAPASVDTVVTQEALIDRLKSKFFGNTRAPRPFMTEEGLIEEQLRAMDSNAFGPPAPGASDMNREALLERIRQAALENSGSIPANMLPSVPGGPIRMEVYYDDQGRRDPFEPLLKGMRSGFVSEELPSVEALRMVGVLRDDDRALALLEDTDGHSYIMKPGDPVAHGRVVSVGEMRTIVQVDEYGWTRTVVLQLSPRGADPSKAMGTNAPDPEPEPPTQVTQPAPKTEQ